MASQKKTELKYESITKFGWDQANGKVKVYITSGLDGVGKTPKENISCDFEETSLDLKIQNLNGKNFRLKIAELHNSVKAGECKYNVKSNGITITLVKNTEDRWTDIRPKQSLVKPLKIDESGGDPLGGVQDMFKEMY